ncbi:hypothetical protein [Wolbachia endosymbiont of Zaprionus taronus]|uniref:hypothetical protein n=1 Tax=Wolbachia endosymbiont of Zaprionus taronus TaxID=2603208 RepID=UPI002948D2C6|nr:hypothetical protein [Wolbachia endosymbiont of Zaprionus taronus]MDV6249461.1 hypothetical protein [Wolbachia endosymbiont of Zaprionus taronus]
MKDESLKALIETSWLKCFLGGKIMIFYSSEAVQARVDYNSKKMWFDLELTIIRGAVLGATTVGIGGLLYGGYMDFWAGLRSYSVGASANMLGGYAGGEIISFGKDEIIYKNIEVGEGALYDYKEGVVVSGQINSDSELNVYFQGSSDHAGELKKM